MKISLFSLGWNLKHETLLGILVYTFVLFLHNLCVLNANMSDNALYLETFTFKLAKHKMATKMLSKLHIFYSLSHINAQFMVSARFLIDNFKNNKYFNKYERKNPKWPRNLPSYE